MDSILQKRGVRLTLLLLLAGGAIYGAYRLSAIFAPLLASFIVAYVLDPVADLLERRRFSRLAAVISIFAVGTLSILLVLGLGGYFLYDGIIEFVDRAGGEPVYSAEEVIADPELEARLLPVPGEPLRFDDENGDNEFQRSYLLTAMRYVERVGERFGEEDYGLAASVRTWLDQKREELDSPEKRAEIRARVQLRVQQALDWLAGAPVRAFFGPEPAATTAPPPDEEGSGLLAALFSWASWMLLCPLYIFYLLLEIDPLVAKIRGYLPGRYRTTVVRIVGKIDRTMASFFRGRLLICVFKGLGTSVGLLIVGVPFALPLGIAAGFLALVPYVGIWFAIIPTVLLTWFDAQAIGPLVAVAGVFAVMEVLEGFWMVPTFLGKEVGLHPLTVIVTMLVFAELLGLIGILLSVPLAAIAKILLEEFVMPLVREFAAEEEPPSEPTA